MNGIHLYSITKMIYIIYFIFTSMLMSMYKLDIIMFFNWDKYLPLDSSPIPYRFLWLSVTLGPMFFCRMLFHK